jgi:hypothetical protein
MKEFITKDKLKDKFSYKKTKNIKPEPVEKKEEAEKPKHRPSKKERIEAKRKVRV